MNICFMIYVNSYFYGAQYEAFSFLCQISILIMAGFIRFYEQEAIRRWNPFGTYTPSINNPRAAYHIV